ncbi:MAG: hypothetical protein KAY24_16440 [Candidatus Eisenbacteria sp.]|nr:hypothetical protein [Candidatus Eisenbacteria bacterium]
MSEHWSESLRANEWASRYNMTLEELEGQAAGDCEDNRVDSSETTYCHPEVLVKTGDCFDDPPMEGADSLAGAMVLDVVVEASLDLVAEGGL